MFVTYYSYGKGHSFLKGSWSNFEKIWVPCGILRFLDCWTRITRLKIVETGLKQTQMAVFYKKMHISISRHHTTALVARDWPELPWRPPQDLQPVPPFPSTACCSALASQLSCNHYEKLLECGTANLFTIHVWNKSGSRKWWQQWQQRQCGVCQQWEWGSHLLLR